MPDITLPTPLWEKLDDIMGRLGGIEAEVKNCKESIKETSEYQHVQNGNLARALEEVARIRESATSASGATIAATTAASAATVAATAAATEIARLREKLAISEGEAKGVGLTWQWILAVGMFLLGIISPCLVVAHMVWG